MPSGTSTRCCGDVVKSGNSVFAVQSSSSSQHVLLRLEKPSRARHRADVSPGHWSEIALCGLPAQEIVIRCVPIRRSGPCKLTKLGHLSEAMCSRIATAVSREMLIRRFEGSPSMRSNLMASTSSNGRRVGAVRQG